MDLKDCSKLAGESPLLRGIINAEPECVKVLDREGVPLLINPAGLRMMEADSFDQVAGRSVLSMVLEEDIPHVQQLFARVFSGNSGRLRYGFRSLKGSILFVEIHAAPFRDEAGHVQALIGVTRDITAQVRAEEALAALRQRDQALVAALGEVIYDWEPPLNRITWGGAFTAVFGYSPAEMGNTTESWVQRIHPEDLPKVLLEVQKVTIEKHSFNLEYRFRRSDGAYLWMQDRGAAFLDNQGVLTRIIGVFLDISERKAAEFALRDASDRYLRQRSAVIQLTRSRVLQSHDLDAALREIAEIAANTLDTDRVGVWTFNLSRTVLTCVELFERGRAAHSRGQELEAAKYPSYFHALTHEDILAASDACADPRTSEFLRNYLQPLGICAMLDVPIRQGGELIGVLCHEQFAHPRPWAADEEKFAVSVAGFVALVLSQASRQKIEEQLRQSQKMEAIGQLAGGVAHDFNNFLAVIMMQVDLLKMESGSLSSEFKEGLNIISGATEYAANLTRQLLLFSRKQVMQPKDLDLNEAVTSISRMLQRVIGAHISLKLHLQSTPLLTCADPGMLDQILINLAVNARDAMPDGGSLLIETRSLTVTRDLIQQYPEAEPSEYVSFSVTDSGIGIPPEILPRVFEPFFTTKAPEKGTGLGLATVFGIVKQHRGFIKVYSEPSKGSRFQIYLPAIARTAPNASGAASSKPRGGNETILIAEDDDSLRVLTRITLERSGYTVLEAADAAQAVQLWERHKSQIALLLTDMVMPGGFTGQQLAERLRSEQPTLKVIYTSGYSAEFAGRQISLREGDNFVQKPAPPDQLLETVRRCLDSGAD